MKESVDGYQFCMKHFKRIQARLVDGHEVQLDMEKHGVWMMKSLTVLVKHVNFEEAKQGKLIKEKY